MSTEYDSPSPRAAALMRMLKSDRKRRFFWRRSRYAKTPARSTVSLAVSKRRRRPPTYPLACLRTFLRRRGGLGPPFAPGLTWLLYDPLTLPLPPPLFLSP